MAQAFHELPGCLFPHRASIAGVGHAAINVDAHAHEVVRAAVTARVGIDHAMQSAIQISSLPILGCHAGFELADSIFEPPLFAEMFAEP